MVEFSTINSAKIALLLFTNQLRETGLTQTILWFLLIL